MKNEDRPQLHTNPTELDRRSFFVVGTVFVVTVYVTWNMVLAGRGWWAVPFVLLSAVWMLSVEAAGDVQLVGMIAAPLRSKLGLMDAHEWLLAWGHYCKLVLWPRWKANVRAYKPFQDVARWTLHGCGVCWEARQRGPIG